MFDAEPFDCPHQHRRVQPLPLEDIHQCVGEQLVLDAIRLAEMDGQLQAVVVHNADPSIHPTTAATSPPVNETARFSSPSRRSPSSPSRSVSSITVEKVVNEPSRAVPSSSIVSLASESPVKRPRQKAPR